MKHQHLYDVISWFLAGGTVTGVIAHAVNTFPTPENKYAAWLLGSIQFAVGQREAGKNTLRGMDTEAMGVMKPGKQNGG
jgi:hypothetical protein